MEESLSISEGSRGTVAWIQQKASIASVLTPDLFLEQWINIGNFVLLSLLWSVTKPCVEDTVYGVPKVLFGCCERRHTRQQKHRHLF